MNQVSCLYIHLPFCARRCGYCDFYSETKELARARPYVGALKSELDDFTSSVGTLESVYLGGGTPTFIGTDLLEEVLAGVLARASDRVEVTVEANPATITEELARRLKTAGVNRISLGVQSFLPRLRRNLDRGGDARINRRAVDLLRTSGFRNIGLDMIFGIPGQKLSELRRDIEHVLALEPEHVSYYELTAKAGSPYRRKWGAELDAAQAQGRLFYQTVADSLESAGYQWYETSNFALPGHECRHNLAYWGAGDYIGLGAGAWSTVGAVRWRNIADIEGYIAAAASGRWHGARQVEELSREEKLREQLILGLRRREGADALTVAEAVDASAQKLLQRNGFLVCEGDKICLTRAGRFVANEVCARLLKG